MATNHRRTHPSQLRHLPACKPYAAVAAMAFLLWTLSSSTFLDASTVFVEKQLRSVKTISDRTTQQLEMVLQNCLR